MITCKPSVRYFFVALLVLKTTLVFLMIELKRTAMKKTMAIYFINLDQSIARRKSFEKEMSTFPLHLSTTASFHRVSAIDSKSAKVMFARGNIKVNGNETESEKDKLFLRYNVSEVACTLSHLKAIVQAYKDGVKTALIVEDDAMLTTEFFENWQAYAALAPKDWAILQWSTNNAVVNRKEVHRSNDFWVSWSGHHWSTIAYTIKREAMKRVLKHTSNIFSKSREPLKWKLDVPEMIVSDELIYFLAGNTYTSTYCWVTSRRFSSTIKDNQNQPWVDFVQSNYVPKPKKSQAFARPESIVVVMSMRLGSEEEIKNEFRSLDADISMLRLFNPHTQWLVQVVLTNFSLLHLLNEQILHLARNSAMLEIKISNDLFNKFVFVYECLDVISKYDFLLLKDNDIRLAGFEWNTFLNRRGTSEISAPYVIGIEGLTGRKKRSIHASKKTTNYEIGFQDGALFNPYRSKRFQRIATIPVMMLEMFMVFMRSEFALWFFRQVLTRDFLSSGVDWGPDLMWCAAAYDFQKRNVSIQPFPCSLVSVNVKHFDTRQIIKSHEYVESGNRLIDGLKKRFATKQWMKTNPTSRVYFHQLWHWCKKNSKGSAVIDCLEDFHLGKIKQYSSSLNMTFH